MYTSGKVSEVRRSPGVLPVLSRKRSLNSSDQKPGHEPVSPGFRLPSALYLDLRRSSIENSGFIFPFLFCSLRPDTRHRSAAHTGFRHSDTFEFVIPVAFFLLNFSRPRVPPRNNMWFVFDAMNATLLRQGARDVERDAISSPLAKSRICVAASTSDRALRKSRLTLTSSKCTPPR